MPRYSPSPTGGNTSRDACCFLYIRKKQTPPDYHEVSMSSEEIFAIANALQAEGKTPTIA